MPRKARVVVAGHPHHVTQRGNNRQRVFFTGDDRQAYLDRLFSYSGIYRVSVLAYCLMPNHVHVVAVPVTGRGLSKLFGRLHADYARAVNFHQRTTGHLWQERFYSCAMDEAHTLQAMAYVEQNPLRAGIVRKAESYQWSSARWHLAGEDPAGRLEFTLWRKWYTPEQWREVLASSLSEQRWEERFHESTRRGLPFGSLEFVSQLAAGQRMSLDPHPPGRPRRPAEIVVSAMT